MEYISKFSNADRKDQQYILLFLYQYLTYQNINLLIIFIIITCGFYMTDYCNNSNCHYWWNLTLINLLLLTTIVYVGGLFITYIYPKNIRVKLHNHEFIIPHEKFIKIDLLLHQIPYLIILGYFLVMLNNNSTGLANWSFSLSDCFPLLFYLMIYLLIYNPFVIYSK